MIKPTFFVRMKSDDDLEAQKIAYACQELNLEHHCQKYIPFGGMTYEFLPKDKPIIALSSINCYKHLQKQKLFLVDWCNWDKLKCSTYYAYLGKYLLNEVYSMIPLAEIIRLKSHFYDIYGPNIFIKPDNNDKDFDGNLVPEKNFDLWLKTITRYSPPPESLCVISSQKTILKEWRVFVADKAITASCYKENNLLNIYKDEPKEVMEFAEEIFKIWSPHPILVIDIAETKNGLKLVEIGSVCVAGFYEANIKLVIDIMANLVGRSQGDHCIEDS